MRFGGEGRRFGGTKQLAELEGRPLLTYAVEAMLAVPALVPMVVVLGHDADAIRERVDFIGADTVVCTDWREGQAASLRCGIAALGGPTPPSSRSATSPSSRRR